MTQYFYFYLFKPKILYRSFSNHAGEHYHQLLHRLLECCCY